MFSNILLWFFDFFFNFIDHFLIQIIIKLGKFIGLKSLITRIEFTIKFFLLNCI